ncbi:MAG TPA: helix-turn-helix transcriptional regulator [Candidatus Caccalectryoclostridium excrementigallinarum]|uniref:Helix-turn-helix transcriptional regulator n=1 Tax=Candidatus Caccalectryoclostridium excrementigallinarum TaxID=2840710 RepID=A0A9D1MKT4_9FIRM|nr:helix-turn-helix transcriptional regulator [Candidatus Caccalectryoclostridium excrementigallinarum]
MKFAERLRQERILNGYNQTYIAKYMNVSQVSVSNWERGLKEPDYQTLIDLAKLFNKSTDYMLGVTDR